MSFVFPSFLFALSVLAIPLIIHLFNFRRYKKVYFSDIRFLKEVTEETQKTRQLKRWIVFALRCLALIFLVLAFAQPYIPGSAKVKKGRTAVSVFVDNSFSMQSLGSDRPLLESARKSAIEIANAQSEDALFQLLTEDMEGHQQRLLSKDEFIQAVETIKPGTASHTLDEIAKRQRDALFRENFDVRKSYVISDFQKYAGLYPADSSWQIYLLPLKSLEQKNVFIDTAWLENPVSFTGQSNRFYVRVQNASDKELSGGRMELQLNGQVKGITELNIPANGYSLDTLNLSFTQAGWNQAIFSLNDHPITFDDKYYTAFHVYNSIQALVIEQSEQSRYFKALFSSAPFFRYQQVPVGQLDYSQIKTQQLIILDNLDKISGGLSAELQSWVDAGGNLVVFPSAKADLKSYNDWFKSAEIQAFTGIDEEEREVNVLNLQENIFRDVFDRVPKNISLPKTHFSYRTTGNISRTEERILGFKDGGSFLSKYTAGKGRIYVFTSPLDGAVTDLPMHAIFVPMIFKMAVIGNAQLEIAHTLGSETRIRLNASDAGPDKVYVLKDKNAEWIPDQQTDRNGISLILRGQVQEAGIFEVQRKDAAEDNNLVALNFNRQESALTFYAEKELEDSYKGTGVQILQGGEGLVSAAVQQLEGGIALWKLCVIFVLIFLAAEILVIRLMKDA